MDADKEPFWKIVYVFLLGLALEAGFLSWAVVCIIGAVTCEMHVHGRLQRAAVASTPELAEQELAAVVAYLEERNGTAGTTAIFVATPDCDVEFWYKNLQAELMELRKVHGKSEMEKDLALMNLRQVLLSRGHYGTVVVAPYGLNVFPWNVAFFWWGLVGFLLFLCGGLVHVAWAALTFDW